MECMTSHLFQLALVAARCSGVDVPNTSPRIFGGGSCGAERYDYGHHKAEHKHPAAEEEPVAIVEDAAEQAVAGFAGVAVIYFGGKACEADYKTGDKCPHATLCCGALPEYAHEECGGDAGCEHRLYVLQIKIQYVADGAHHRYPEYAEDYNCHSGHLADAHEFFRLGVGFEALVEVDGEKGCR